MSKSHKTKWICENNHRICFYSREINDNQKCPICNANMKYLGILQEKEADDEGSE